ncbi:MAG: hypothetical protein Q8Q89_05165 [bacterium]|nr:hypothetical protein [bacterium]
MATSRFKLNLLLLILLVIILTALFVIQSEGSQLLSGRNIEIQGANLASVVLQNQWTLLDKIEEGKELLKNSPPLEFVEIKKKLIRKQIELAVLDIESGDVFLKRYWLENKDINLAYDAQKVYKGNPDLPRFTPVDPNEDFEVVNNWWNGWASDWGIEKIASNSSDIYVIVADKYSVPNSYIIYPEDKTGTKYSDIVFSPPSEALHDQEVVNNGKEYINKKADAAFEELRNFQVMSRAFPGELVVDTISKTFVKNILLVEQTDPDSILNRAKTDEEKRRVAEKVLLRYGLNGNKSFRYTVSSAGALGLAQIMQTTYTLPKKKEGMLEVYPDANLIRDSRLGRVDPVNAIKAQILVFDDKIRQIKQNVYDSGPRAIKVFESLTENQLNEVRAMGYNGGASKYNLSTGGLKTGVRGYNETKQFIEKYRVISYLKLFIE